MSPAEAEKKAREMLVEHIQDDKFGMGWNVAYESLEESIAAALLQAVEAEREACAKVAENALGWQGVPCKQAGAAIRARGKSNA